jgi:hypothetical protein
VSPESTRPSLYVIPLYLSIYHASDEVDGCHTSPADLALKQQVINHKVQTQAAEPLADAQEHDIELDGLTKSASPSFLSSQGRAI